MAEVSQRMMEGTANHLGGDRIDLSELGFEITIPQPVTPDRDSSTNDEEETKGRSLKHQESGRGECNPLGPHEEDLDRSTGESIGISERTDFVSEKLSFHRPSLMSPDNGSKLLGEDDHYGFNKKTALDYEDMAVPSRSQLGYDDSSVYSRLSTGKPIRNRRSSNIRRASQCSGVSRRRSNHSTAQQSADGSFCSTASSFWNEGEEGTRRSTRRLSIASHSSLRRSKTVREPTTSRAGIDSNQSGFHPKERRSSSPWQVSSARSSSGIIPQETTDYHPFKRISLEYCDDDAVSKSLVEEP